MKGDSKDFENTDVESRPAPPDAVPAGVMERCSVPPPPDVRDPILRLRMPGCYGGKGSMNAAARKFFASFVKALEDESEVLCHALTGPNAVLDYFCPFERDFAERELRKLKEQEPGETKLVAFALGNRNGTATYRVFVSHALAPSEPGTADFRLLPLPASVVELVTKEVFDPAVPAGSLGRMPVALEVQAHGAVPVETGKHNLLPEDEKLFQEAREIIEKLIDDPPSLTWRQAQIDHGDFLVHLPMAIRGLLEKYANDPDKLREQMRTGWKYPVDAPILANVVLPKIHDTIRQDRDLKYLPKDEEEQLQYLRARLPLKELQEQDRYLRWLPLPDDWDPEKIGNSPYDTHS